MAQSITRKKEQHLKGKEEEEEEEGGRVQLRLQFLHKITFLGKKTPHLPHTLSPRWMGDIRHPSG